MIEIKLPDISDDDFELLHKALKGNKAYIDTDIMLYNGTDTNPKSIILAGHDTINEDYSNDIEIEILGGIKLNKSWYTPGHLIFIYNESKCYIGLFRKDTDSALESNKMIDSLSTDSVKHYACIYTENLKLIRYFINNECAVIKGTNHLNELNSFEEIEFIYDKFDENNMVMLINSIAQLPNNTLKLFV